MYSSEFSWWFLLALISAASALALILLMKYGKSVLTSKRSQGSVRMSQTSGLPDELMNRIFLLLDRKELHRAGATCKSWQNVSKKLTRCLVLKDELSECAVLLQEDSGIDYGGDTLHGGRSNKDTIDCGETVIFPEILLDYTRGKPPLTEYREGGGFLYLHRGRSNKDTGGETVIFPEILLDYTRGKPSLTEYREGGGFVYPVDEGTSDKSIDDYTRDTPVVKSYTLYDKTEVCLCNDDGISLWLGFLTLLLTAFQAGKSWGGSFGLQHLRVKNKNSCKIDMEPSCQGTYENLLLDLAKLANLLIGYFKDQKNNTAIYIYALYQCMVSPKIGSGSSYLDQLRYLKFLSNHLAFSTAAKRMALIKEIYQAFKSMVDPERRKFRDTLKKVKLIARWKPLAINYALFLKVLTFKFGDPSSTHIGYGKMAQDFLRFLRNLFQHGSEHTIVDGQQTMTNIEELDYMAAVHFSDPISDMLYELVMIDMAGTLQNSWNNYSGCKEQGNSSDQNTSSTT